MMARTLVASVLLLLLCASGAAAAATSSGHASLLVASEAPTPQFPQGIDVTTSGVAGGKTATVAASVAAHAPTAYYTVPAGMQTLNVMDHLGGGLVASVGVDMKAGKHYTLFVATNKDGQGVAVVLADDIEWPRAYIDLAKFRVVNGNQDSYNVMVSGTSDNCYKCLKRWRTNASNPAIQFPELESLVFQDVAVPHSYVLEFVDANTGKSLANLTMPFREHGSYTVVVPTTGAANAYVVTYDKGHNTAVPLILTVVALGVLALAFWGVNTCRARAAAKAAARAKAAAVAAGGSEHDYDEMAQGQADIKPTGKKRVLAIDTFRGISLTIMIFVNYGGGGYWWLNHSWWNGLTVADLVFPWFVWIMGVSMAISHASAVRRGKSKAFLLKKIGIRAIKLAAIGMFLNNGQDLSNWRFPGVLQYFAISSFVVGYTATLVPTVKWFGDPDKLVAANPSNAGKQVNGVGAGGGAGAGAGGGAETTMLMEAGVTKTAAQRRVCLRRCRDVGPFILQYLPIVAAVTLYLGLQFGLDVPGCGRGYIGPGGYGDYGRYEGCTGGAHGYIDRLIWGDHHMYHSVAPGTGNAVSAATCAGPDRYNCNVYDPEGTLGSLTAILMCFLGLQAGRILVFYKLPRERLLRWVCWGLAECAIATALCGASQNEGIIPLAKNLWSPSFILLMGGLGNLVLAVLYVIIDMKQLWPGVPFRYVGMNSIVVYAFSEILQNFLPFTIMLHPTAATSSGFNTHTAALVANTIGVLVWCLIAYLFYRNKFFYNL